MSASREDLDRALTAAYAEIDELKRRLKEAEKLSVHFESCNFQGLNPDGSEPFIYEHLPNGFKRVIGVRMQGWYCQGPLDRPVAP